MLISPRPTNHPSLVLGNAAFNQCSRGVVRRVQLAMDATSKLAWSTVDEGRQRTSEQAISVLLQWPVRRLWRRE